MSRNNSIVLIALIVALGGFLMGFDASVISGVNKFIKIEFDLTDFELGWAVASLTLTSTLAMFVAGPLSDRYGRKRMLSIAAVLYAISAIGSAIAPSYLFLVIARMIGGLGVGISLILAPMYIAELAPPQMRGRLVSFNQLNIVIGISVAFFTNYLILQLGDSDASWAQSLKFDEYNWRWMLGLETLPAILYFFGLFIVPRSPRWLIMKGKFDLAMAIMKKQGEEEEDIKRQIEEVRLSLQDDTGEKSHGYKELLKPALRLVLLIGIVVGAMQQFTGINSVFFYAPMIFEQSGVGENASFTQAIYVGLINLVFTIVAIMFIDRLGRKPLLVFGVGGIVLCMGLLSYGFGSATYTITDKSIETLSAPSGPEGAPLLPPEQIASLQSIKGTVYESDIDFKAALKENMGEEAFVANESKVITQAIDINSDLVLVAILGFVACFAVSIGPVMWVLFSELFPNYIRGVAISFVGFINSTASFLVQLVFPWELSTLGNSMTFLIYGAICAVGLIFIILVIPETKGRSLEELEEMLVKNK
jgi:SP family arabinose:H+ symporter-like MFS transporter